MLELQKFLREGNSPEDLNDKLGIRIYQHPTKPLIGFKYCQLNSPKLDPIVRECRGVVLEDKTWNLVAKPFGRFYNVGEVEEEYKKFDWSDYIAMT